jgi:predicted PurR-regulated permease PerM
VRPPILRPMEAAGGQSSNQNSRAEAATWFARGAGFSAGGLVVLAIAEGLIGAGSVLLLVFVAILLASALRPIVDRLRTNLPIRRGMAVLIVYAIFLGLVVVIGFLLVPLVVEQASQLGAQLPSVFDRLQTWSAGLSPHELATSIGGLVGAAQNAVKIGPSAAGGQVLNVGLSIAGAVVSVVTVLALVFFWLTERQRLQRYLLSYLPPDRRSGLREGWNIVELRLGAWVRGQLVLMVALGVATGVAYTVLGLPSGPVLGVIAGLAEVIPLVGPAIGVVPALLIAAAFRPDLLLVVIVVYLVIQLVESNFLVPFVMRNAVGVSPFLLSVSLLAGGAIGGLLGALIAVPVVAAMEAVFERMQDRETPVAQDSASDLASSLTASTVNPPSDPP